MTQYFSVRNFDEFQHYKDRNPPWIKLYNQTLENYNLCELPDDTKYHLIAIWLLASRSSNKMPLDAAWIAGKIGAKNPIDLQALIDAEFIYMVDEKGEEIQPLPIVAQDASNALSLARSREREQSRAEQRESRAEGEGAPQKQTPAKRARQIPEGFELDAGKQAYARSKGIDHVAVRQVWEQFVDHHRAKGSTMKDWNAAWRTWVMRERKFCAERAKGKQGGSMSAVERVERASGIQGDVIDGEVL